MMISKRSCAPLDISIGKNIKRLRLSRDYTLKYTARTIDVSQQQLSKYETGLNRICAVRLFGLAEALDVDIMEFFA